MATRIRKPGLPDFHLWTEVTRTVSPLPRRRPLPIPPPAGPAMPAPPEAPAKQVRPARKPTVMPSYQAPPQRPQRDPKPSIEPKLRRKLTRGRIEIDGTLDLHGMRQNEARAALNRFLVSRWERGDRTILVITGKGLKKLDDAGTKIIERGVLRAMLPQWLSEPQLQPIIAGWDVAAQIHGGDGAAYVRLRRFDQP